jgi:hypothetical protein
MSVQLPWLRDRVETDGELDLLDELHDEWVLRRQPLTGAVEVQCARLSQQNQQVVVWEVLLVDLVEDPGKLHHRNNPTSVLIHPNCVIR